MTLETQRGTVGGPSSRIATDTLSYGFIAGVQQKFSERVFNPLADETATERLLELRESWRKAGQTTVFTSGFYDLFHLDHAGYALHSLSSGIAHHYERTTGNLWDILSAQRQEEHVARFLSAGDVRLITSVASDANAAVTKGGKIEKGGAPRPIQSWNTRALMMASQAFIDPLDPDGERLLRTNSAVTLHSTEGAHDVPPDSPHASHMNLAAALQPDVWVIYGESTLVLEQAPVDARLSAIALRCIQAGEGTHYFEDDIMGKMSTTKITQRIRGEI